MEYVVEGVTPRGKSKRTHGDHFPDNMKFSAVCGTPAHVKCYSYHAGTSVIVSGGARNATVHDPKQK